MRRTHNAIQASNLNRFERRAGDIRPYSNFLLRKKLLLAGLGPLGAVLGTGLHPAVDALGIQRAADDGFLGVEVRTAVQTPLFWGACRSV